jgi:N-acetylneuraminate synthase
MGSADKQVGGNEQATVIVQRRCLRAARDVQPGEVFTREMIDVLRPATPGAILPYEIDAVLGKKATVALACGQELRWTQLGE